MCTLSEIIKCTDPVNGFKYFTNTFIKIQHPIKGPVEFNLNEFQQHFIGYIKRKHHCFYLTARQMGVTTTMAAFVLWNVLFRRNYTALIASNKHYSALEIMERIRYMYDNLPDQFHLKRTENNKSSIEFENGSRILASTTNACTARGISVDLLVLDQLALVAPSIDVEELVKSCAANCKQIVITSSAGTLDSNFHKLWLNLERIGCKHVNKSVYDYTWHPYPKSCLEAKNKLTEKRFKQEYECRFVGIGE